jgi:hypothetical protein
MNSGREALLGNNEAIQSVLADSLMNGQLMVVLGSGVSATTEIPNWLNLVNTCIQESNSQFSKDISTVSTTSSNSELLKKMTLVKQASKTHDAYLDIVKKSLYKDLDTSRGYLGLMKNDLLIALGSLMMGSYRGKVGEVITYNFDDVLEHYLDLHGFVTQIVVDPLSLAGNADVRVYHPHGFLPHQSKFDQHDELIFDQISFDERLGAHKGAAWRKNLELLLSTKTTLFIGLSGDDPTFGPLFSSINESQKSRDIIGYWIRTKKQSAEDVAIDELRKVISVILPDHDAIPEFLLGISRVASNSYNRA